MYGPLFSLQFPVQDLMDQLVNHGIFAKMKQDTLRAARGTSTIQGGMPGGDESAGGSSEP